MMMTKAKKTFTIYNDAQTGFHLIGDGVLGGKGEGLVVLATLLQQYPQWRTKYPDVQMGIPETLVITSHGFEMFIEQNKLTTLADGDADEAEIVARFLNARLPEGLQAVLDNYLNYTTYPLAVRSSGLLEDAHLHAYAGLYRTYMLSNDQPDRTQRLAHLAQAVKLIYASAYSEGPRAYARRVGHRLEDDRMAVIVQQLVGLHHDDYYFPTFSGVADSLNYYPMAGMKAEDGTVAVAIGLGKQVVSGERALRFSPKYPRRLIQRTSVEEMLAYSQRSLYALQMGSQSLVGVEDRDNLVQLNIADVEDRLPMHLMAGTYVQAEHRVRETTAIPGPRVVTFSGILKHELLPLAELLQDVLAAAEMAMNSAVELEFAVNIAPTPQQPSHFYLLQLRPMAARGAGAEVTIDPNEPRQAICYTEHAMGNVNNLPIMDIVYVKPDAFAPGRTREVAGQLARINDHLAGRNRTYLLVGPGRWGSADPWLGIPVRWSDISGVAAIVETTSENLKADPSLGAHFFHNLAALGISYLCVTGRGPDHFNWSWVTSHTIARQEQFVAHVRLDRPIEIKVDGRTSRGLIKGND
jgi:hypothetical protein